MLVRGIKASATINFMFMHDHDQMQLLFSFEVIIVQFISEEGAVVCPLG